MRPKDDIPTVPPAINAKGRSRNVALTGILSAVIAVLTLGFSLPAPLSTITFAPIAIFVAGTYFGPRIGFISSAVGSFAGFIVGASIGTINASFCPGVYPVFLAGIVLARGPEGFIVGKLRSVDESLGMIAGTVFETAVFFAIDFFYTAPVLCGVTKSAVLGFASLDLLTLVDLIYIGPALVAIRGLRSQSGKKYYDRTV